jgi:hypothetical protein
MTGTATIAPGRKAMPQRLQALEQANRVRLARAELKRRVAAGQLGAAEVILAMPWETVSMPVAELLTSQRRWGAERSRRCLGLLQIPENKHIGTMTERQRRALAGALEAGGPG